MEPDDFERFNRWLGITIQEFEILISLHELEIRGKETKPKAVLEEYSKRYGKRIKPPNLFGILKTLVELQIVSKLGKGTYIVNMSAIREIIQSRKKDFEIEMKNFEGISSKIEEFFQKGSIKNTKPYVEYIRDRKAFWDMVNPRLKEIREYYIVAGFPGISYTEEVSTKGIQRGEYLDIIKNQCFNKKELRITYLSPLSINKYPLGICTVDV
ncbi:MAG: hypothetical protein V1875_02755 [Candidatus Altiarchaeota archaeon]